MPPGGRASATSTLPRSMAPARPRCAWAEYRPKTIAASKCSVPRSAAWSLTGVESGSRHLGEKGNTMPAARMHELLRAGDIIGRASIVFYADGGASKSGVKVVAAKG
jgi:hypothetical protein